jgi:iron complex outermembrane receptor protein
MLSFITAVPPRFLSKFITKQTLNEELAVRLGAVRFSLLDVPFKAMGWVLLGCSLLPLNAFSQSKDQAPSTTPVSAASSAAAQNSVANAPVLPRVTTTVVVHDEVKDEYLSEAVTVGNLDRASLQETPLSVMELTREMLYDQGARLLSDLVKNDASVGEDYAPVGYYGDFEIRGIPIDLATGLQINGMTVAGEQDVPLENKERVEILKGIAGVESGVTSAGGLIDYVTKRPVDIEAVDLATDHRGSTYGAVDLGHLFARNKVGARLNLAGEKIQSYVNDADGWRAVGAGAADWHINSKTILKGDFEYQHKVERSVCGYQLLGGTTVPDLSRIYPSTMLGEQSWAKPNTFDTFNTGARLDYELPHEWRAFAAASFSHSLIDDNVVYAYGNSIAGPSYFFAPDGTYDIYDYRDPGELRIDAQAEAMVVGHIKTGAVEHDLAAGGVLFRRSVQQPSRAVYDYVGSENIYQSNQAFPIEMIDGVPDQAGPRVLDEDNHQAALVLQDRIHVPGRIQLLVGGREDSLRDHNFSGATTTEKMIWLPQYAALFNPMKNLTLYGNYSVMLSLGLQAPWWTDNSAVYLNPFFTRQLEVGAKYELDHRMMISAALFHMRTPFFYPKVLETPDNVCSYNYAFGTDFAAGDTCFEQEGRETHNGIEVNAEGKAASWLRLTASAAAINAVSDQTGTLAFDNKQVLNVPHLRTALFADLLLPHAHGLHLMPGWSYTGRKEATRDDTVTVSGYNLFNLGASYTPEGKGNHVTLRLYADNIADKRYWKDTGANYGDTFIHLGAPTTVRLSAHYTF